MYLKLKYILMAKGVKQTEVAEVWDCSPMTVSNKLTGKSEISISELRAAADAFNLTTSEVLDVIFAR